MKITKGKHARAPLEGIVNAQGAMSPNRGKATPTKTNYGAFRAASSRAKADNFQSGNGADYAMHPNRGKASVKKTNNGALVKFHLSRGK